MRVKKHIKSTSVKMILVVITCILAVINLYYGGEREYLNLNETDLYASQAILEGDVFKELFRSSTEQRGICLKIRTLTWGRVYEIDDMLKIELKKHNNNQCLDSIEIPLSSFQDNDLSNYLFFDSVKLEKGEWYELELTSNSKEKPRSISLVCTALKDDVEAYAMVNGAVQAYNFGLIIYE